MFHLLFQVFVLSLSVFADGFKYSSPPFVFRTGASVFVFDLPTPGNQPKLRVCFSEFVNETTGEARLGTAIPSDGKICTAVNEFGNNEQAYVQQAASSLSQEILPPDKENDVVTINNREWRRSDFARVIFREVERKNGEPIYASVCALEITPANRFNDGNRPEKYLFCHSQKSTKLQAKHLDGKPYLRQNGDPMMISTVVCPSAEKCLSKEWAIEPTLEILPDSDDDLAPHAPTKRGTQKTH